MLANRLKSDGGDDAKSGILTHFKCFLFCLAVAVSNFQYGFDTAIVNGFQAIPGFLRVFGVKGPSGTFEIQTTFQQLITSLLQVGLIVASLLIGPVSTYLGRRASFAVASVISFVGITIQVLATAQWLVYIGRLLMGIGNGMYVTLTVLYISEIAPAHLRGVMVSVFQVFTNFGGFVGAVVSNALHNNPTKLSYQIQLAILYAVPLYLLLIVYFLPESPRWLAVRGQILDAKRSLVRLRPSSTKDEDIVGELHEITESIRAAKETAKARDWKEIWKGTDLRRTLLATACATFHAASGINLLVGYATFFFTIADTGEPFTNTIILQTVNVVTALMALPLARRFGRRPLLLAGLAITSISMFCIAIVYTIAPTQRSSGKALVALTCIFIGTYGCTIGPLSWVTAGEMPSNHLRSYTFGVGMGVSFVFAWLTTFTTPFFINTTALNWGAKVAWIWAPSNVITLVFIYIFLPETKGRSLEQLDEMFASKLSARAFKGYPAKFLPDGDDKESSVEKEEVPKESVEEIEEISK